MLLLDTGFLIFYDSSGTGAFETGGNALDFSKSHLQTASRMHTGVVTGFWSPSMAAATNQRE